ncbi:nucleoside triphosphate pyrophosphohydrolase family protein [candidate division WWE3 bacterium]|uniref:Nucleoside triphosphate pyrophosphohydrolase family protein n=1 Tax=candidate division WWE3 bacterium TaxID=2053526 RepID=A0A955RX36_UNCKA|nr:nucleoside triphosphate pyrophosphohydrolase family protein [candidate division WWE3 bacterium]
MTFSEYQNESRKTAIYPNVGKNYIYPTLGLVGEAGEVAEKIKKVLRDTDGIVSDETISLLKKELGDVLWYVAQLAAEFGFELDEVAQHNIDKLNSRKERGVLKGTGDAR